MKFEVGNQVIINNPIRDYSLFTNKIGTIIKAHHGDMYSSWFYIRTSDNYTGWFRSYEFQIYYSTHDILEEIINEV